MKTSAKERRSVVGSSMVTLDVMPDQPEDRIRVVDAPHFIATKLDSFRGRAEGDFFHHDMEDIVAVGRHRLERLMKLSPEDIRRIQRSQVRWMGMGVGIFLMLVGSAFAIGAFLTVGAVLHAGIERSDLPLLLLIFAAEMGLGVPMLLYGRSMFRRARTEPIVLTGPPK